MGLLLLLFARTLGATVTFSARAAPAQRLLPELGRKIGMELAADRNVGPNVLLVEVKGVERDLLLKAIADAASGDWERNRNRLRLVRSPSRIRTLWEEDAARRKPFLEDALQRARTRLAKSDPVGAYSKISGQGAAEERAALRMAVAIGADTIAQVRAGDRVVFSSRTLATQRPLPPDAVKAAQIAQREVLASHEKNAARFGEGVFSAAAEEAGRVVGTIHVIVERPLGSDDVAVRTRQYSANGALVLSGSCEMGAPGPKIPTLTEPPLELKPLGRQIVNRDEYLAPGSVPASPELAAALRVPDRVEPIELLLGDPVRALGTAQGVVACIPDGAFPIARLGLRKPLGARRLMATMDLTVQDRDALVVVRPNAPARALSDVAPRDALRDLVAALRPTGRMTFEAIADYANRRPGGARTDSFDWAVLTALYGSAMYDADDGGIRFPQANAAQFLVSLTPEQWRRAAQGPLRTPDFTPVQIGLLRRLFGGGPVTTLEWLSSPARSNLACEPTVLAGAPLQVELVVRTKFEPHLEGVTPGFARAQRVFPRGVGRDPRTRYLPATRREVQCWLQLTGPTSSQPIALGIGFNDVKVQGQTEPMAYDKLPADFRRAFEAASAGNDG